MKAKRHSLCCSLIKYVKAKRESVEARKRVKELNKAYYRAFVDCALAERRLKLRTLENSHLYGLVENLSFLVLRAKSVEKLEKAKSEYYDFKRDSEANLQRQMDELHQVRLFINGKTEIHNVF